MAGSTDVNSIRDDDRAIVRSDERALLLLLLLLSLVALAVFLYYVTTLLGGLPDPIPEISSGAGSVLPLAAVVRRRL